MSKYNRPKAETEGRMLVGVTMSPKGDVRFVSRVADVDALVLLVGGTAKKKGDGIIASLRRVIELEREARS